MLKVLTYHKFQNPENFERHVKYLSSKNLINYTLKPQKGKVIITIDDGDISFYNIAYPILKKYNIPAILFIVTELINTENPFWWDIVLSYYNKDEANDELRRLKSMPNVDRVIEIERLQKKIGLKYEQLTVNHLREMRDNGILIANHSHTHPMFNQCTEEEIKEELRETKKFFKNAGLDGYEIFAFPNGNFSMNHVKLLKSNGIKQAYLFDHNINKPSTNGDFLISRLSVNDTTPLWKFKLILSGIHTKIVPLTKLIMKIFNRI